MLFLNSSLRLPGAERHEDIFLTLCLFASVAVRLSPTTLLVYECDAEIALCA